jgi:hypothetical protein
MSIEGRLCDTAIVGQDSSMSLVEKQSQQMAENSRMISLLAEVDEKGFFVRASTKVLDDCADRMDGIKNIENTSITSASHTILKATRDELVDGINKYVHRELAQVIMCKIDIIIEEASACTGDIQITMESETAILRKTKTAIIFRVASCSMDKLIQLYDCFIQTISLEMPLPTKKMCMIGGLTSAGISIGIEHGNTKLATAAIAFGLVVAVAVIKPRIPDYADTALTALMIDRLRCMGWLAESGDYLVTKHCKKGWNPGSVL